MKRLASGPLTRSRTLSSPALEILDLHFRYPGSDREVLHVASLRLDAGDQLLLTGGSGSGKSTLLSIVAGLMRPSHGGSIRVAGRELPRGAAGDRFRGRHIGMIFQTFNLLTGFSAVENVLAALMFSDLPRREHLPRARALLHELGVEEADRPAERLSVGQQQRVAVARALACRPVLVLADEPTASLDPENAGVAIGLIQRTCRECNAALLCTSHDPAMGERFARRVSLTALASTVPSGAGA